MIVRLDLKRAFDTFYSTIDHSHNVDNLSYSNVLKTTAQTLSGAINEHEATIKNLKETINRLTAITIEDGNLTTIDQDYILIKEINTDFTASCTINVDSESENGFIGFGVIRFLPNESAINNVAGISIQGKIDANGLFTFFDDFNDNSNISLEYDRAYKFILKREGNSYTGSIYDIITENLIISKTITNTLGLEYLVIWGAGNLSFNYSNVQLNANYLLKTQNQTLVGAINELYDDQEFIWTNLTDKINEL